MINVTFDMTIICKTVFIINTRTWHDITVLQVRSINRWTPYSMNDYLQYVCQIDRQTDRPVCYDHGYCTKQFHVAGDFLYLSLWQQSRSSLWEQILCCLSTMWWRGCWSLSMMDNSLFSVLLSTRVSKASSLRPSTNQVPFWWFYQILSGSDAAAPTHNSNEHVIGVEGEEEGRKHSSMWSSCVIRQDNALTGTWMALWCSGSVLIGWLFYHLCQS